MGLVGAQFIGGVPGSPGLGVVGVGAPGDGVRGLASGATPSGQGVAGHNVSPSVSHAGVMGEAHLAAAGVPSAVVEDDDWAGVLVSVAAFR